MIPPYAIMAVSDMGMWFNVLLKWPLNVSYYMR